MKNFLPLLGLALLSASPAFAQFDESPPSATIEKARTKWPGVHFDISSPRASYALGENIPLVMHYRNDGKTGLRVEVVNYDRSGRIMDFGFRGHDADGHAVRDPFPFRGGIGGGLRGMQGLGKYEQTVSLNEWLSFDHPGHYVITAWSNIVEEVGPEGTSGANVPLQSAPLELDITAPDEASRKARLDAASAAIAAAEKLVATLPTTQASYERDQKLGPQVGAAMRDLRWMDDARAIPLLMRGLEIGGSAAFEAHRGLASFQDLSPVRAAILARLQSGVPLTENIWAFKDLVARSSPKPQGAGFGIGLSPADQALFNAPVRADLVQQVAAHNGKSAALDAATLLENDAHAPTEAAIWDAFWSGAATLPEERQWAGALLLFQEKQNAKACPVTIADLRRAARDEGVGKQLRSAAVIALAARGDFSLRPLLAQDVTAPKTRFTTTALATLDNYEARPIAVKLLQELRTPDPTSVYAKDELAARLRDFGGGATLEELIAAARWMMVNYPFGQGAALEAVALRDPESGLMVVRESLAKRPAWEYGDSRLRVLVRLDLPAAREQVRNLLGQTHADFVEALVGQIGESTHDDPTRAPDLEMHRNLLAPRTLSESVVPELARLYCNSPSAKVRAAAGSALSEITQVRVPWNDPAQMRPALRAWWQRNAARLGRPASLLDAV